MKTPKAVANATFYLILTLSAGVGLFLFFGPWFWLDAGSALTCNIVSLYLGVGLFLSSMSSLIGEPRSIWKGTLVWPCQVLDWPKRIVDWSYRK